MTTGNDDNCKLPKDAVSKGDIEMTYGFVQGEVRECGYTKIIYNNEEEPDKTTEIRIHPTGDHEVLESNKKKKAIRLSAQSGEHRQYTAGGHSTQVDGHHDVNSESTSRFEVAGDMAHATGKNKLTGVKGQEVKASAGKFNHTSGSSALQASGSSGTVRNSYEKDFFNHIQGDMVSMGEKNMIQVIQKDVAKYIGQNFDTYVKEKGKLEVVGAYSHVSGNTLTVTSKKDTSHSSDAKYSTSSKEDMSHSSDAKLTINGKTEVTITSDTKITLKVGSNSIEITSSGITINAGSGKLDLKASGDVTTQGSTTKLQGGGAAGVPTTIT